MRNKPPCPDGDIHVLWTEFKGFIRLVELWQKNSEENLVKQASEYERRLSDLNHAHEHMTQRNATFLSREVFDAKLHEMNTKMDLGFSRLNWVVAIGIGVAMATSAFLPLVLK